RLYLESECGFYAGGFPPSRIRRSRDLFPEKPHGLKFYPGLPPSFRGEGVSLAALGIYRKKPMPRICLSGACDRRHGLFTPGAFAPFLCSFGIGFADKRGGLRRGAANALFQVLEDIILVQGVIA